MTERLVAPEELDAPDVCSGPRLRDWWYSRWTPAEIARMQQELAAYERQKWMRTWASEGGEPKAEPCTTGALEDAITELSCQIRHISQRLNEKPVPPPPTVRHNATQSGICTDELGT